MFESCRPQSVSQLVPHLTPVEKCSDLPRQICSFGLQSPRVSEKPLVTKWCFDPAEDEQGEGEEEDEDEKEEEEDCRMSPGLSHVSLDQLQTSVKPTLLGESSGQLSQR